MSSTELWELPLGGGSWAWGGAGGRHSDGGEERKGPETGMGRAEGRGSEDMGGPAPARAGGLEVREKATCSEVHNKPCAM